MFYLDTIDELLGRVIHSQEDLDFMMSDPGGLSWKTPAYDAQLRKLLDRSYDTYIRILQRIPKALKIMCEKLGIDDNGKVSSDARNSFWSNILSHTTA